MANRLKQLIASLLYAGLKPRVYAPAPAPGRPGPLREKIERFLSGGRLPSDPLYLSNRTWRQKLKLALGIVIPGALLLGALALVFTNVYKTATPAPKPLERPLPNLEKAFQSGAYQDAEFVQLQVRRNGPPVLVGSLRNKTQHVISVEFEVYLANNEGAHVGTVIRRVENAPPGGLVPIEFPLDSPDASRALVRSIRTVQ